MNNRQIVEIAALVSAYSQHVVAGLDPLPAGALEKFWDRSQRRLKLWLSALSLYQRQFSQVDPLEHERLWTDLEPVLGEILVSEVLSRVWGAVLTARDQEQGTHQTEAIARNVLLGHLDARKRVLQILVGDPALTFEHLGPIDCIRRRVERWTDLLLGHLVERYSVDDFAFDPERAREFGAERLLQSKCGSQEQAWRLLLLGLQSSFSTVPVDPPHEFLQEEIIASILACFSPAAFQPDGPFRPIIAARIICRDPGITATLAPTTNAAPKVAINFREVRRRYPPRQH